MPAAPFSLHVFLRKTLSESLCPIEIPKLIVEDQAEWEHAEHIRAAAAARRKRRVIPQA